MKELTIGLPLYNNLPTQSFLSILKMLHHFDFKYNIIYTSNYPIEIARNTIIQKFLKRDSDYLLFIDSDQILPSNTFQLLKSVDADIVSGVSFKKAYPYYPTIYKAVGQKYKPITNYPKNSVINVDAVGMFCTLIKKRIFDIIEYPWFHFERLDDEFIGEDMLFCREAKKHNFTIKANTNLIIPHVGGIIDDRTFQHTRFALNILYGNKKQVANRFISELSKEDIERMVDTSEEF